MITKKLLTLILICHFSLLSMAQINLEFWPYEKKSIPERKVVQHRYTSESAVKYHKRIQRIIDMRQKQNKPMVWPKSNLVNILHTAALKGPNGDGGIKVYPEESLDKTSRPYTIAEIKSIGADTIYVDVIDDSDSSGDETNTVEQEMVTPLDIRSVRKIRIMEDWIFDHKYSDFRVRIVAIAPLYNLTASGIDLGEQPLYWIKMEDARPLLANKEVFNPHNDHRNLSFDDWFEKRMFSSYIVEESNVYDTEIKYQEEFRDDGLAALLEADRIKNDLFIFEHDNWEY